jgi:hypothetical protein
MIQDTPIELRNLLKLSGYATGENYSTYTPKPTKNDYDAGYIFRYFISAINYSNTIEINGSTYSDVDGSLYRKVKIKWKIAGKKNNVHDGGILKYKGVYEENLLQIRNMKKEFGDIEYILNNPLQFWQGS